MRIAIVAEQDEVVDALRRAATSTGQHEILWSAATGAEAIVQCDTEPPDLLLLTLPASTADEAETTRQIMARSPCPILIVTTSAEDNAGRVFAAMGRGAIDVVDVPAARLEAWSAHAGPLLAKIATISRLIQNSHARRAGSRPGRPPASRGDDRLVAIGASAGGPSALATVLRGLPERFGAAVVVVQHVDERFAGGLAQWLDHLSPLPVRIAREGDRALPGAVLVAGTKEHLLFKTPDRLGYSVEPRGGLYSPSIDVLFRSISLLWPGRALGLLLTGMGNDGAVGLRALRDEGHDTIAQDRATSAVYGMPKAAAALDAAASIVPVERIATLLVEFAGAPATAFSRSRLRP